MLLLLPQLGWAMDFRISGGSESFTWGEYDTNGNKILDETGLRHFIAFDADSWIDSQWQSDFGGRVYSGTVDYDGQTQSGTAVTTDTDYDGIQFEAGFNYYPETAGQLDRNSGRLGIRMAVGADNWRRSILGSGGYMENYSGTYGRVGAHFGGAGFWSFNLGVKYPFAVSESVGLKDIGYASDVTLHPQGRFSVYGDLSLRFSRSWGMSLYYDSYRFAKSDPESVYSPIDSVTYNVWQPESRMDIFGAKLSFTF